MTKKKKIIICVAPVRHENHEMPAGVKNPLTPNEISKDVKNCFNAGASMVHLHVRDKNGAISGELDIFKETLDLICSNTNMVIQGSTGGLSTLSLEERCVALNDSRVEVGSLNMGSVNFWDNVFINTIPDIKFWAKEMQAKNVVPEMEIFDLSMVDTCIKMMNEGYVPSPLYVNFSLGFVNALSANSKNMMTLRNALPNNAVWGVVHDDMDSLSMHAAAISAGANIVRVGFEDGCFYEPGKIAKTNAVLVEKLASLIKLLGFEIASPEEARIILSTKKNIA